MGGVWLYMHTIDTIYIETITSKETYRQTQFAYIYDSCVLLITNLYIKLPNLLVPANKLEAMVQILCLCFVFVFLQYVLRIF